MVVAVLTAAYVVVLGAPRASALTLTASPDPTVDGAPGSLRAAVGAATSPGGDEIDLQAGGTYTLTCAGGGQLTHGISPLTITTPSGSPATIRQTCPGQRVLVNSLGLLTLHNVVITGGNYAPSALVTPTGGAIQENFGPVTVTDSTFENNSLTAPAGEPAPATGGAIGQTGFTLSGPEAITVANSTFTNNSVTASPDPSCLGTPGTCGDAFGGAIGADIPIAVENSTFTDNTATDPQPPGTVNPEVGARGGAIDSSVNFPPPPGGPVTVTSSTFSNNSATAPNAYAYGGAISTDGGPVSTTLTSSVFSHNSVTGQQVAAGGAVGLPDCCGPVPGTTAPPVAATGSTFTDNTATASSGGVGWGGAIGIPVVGGIPPTTMTNSTVTGNTASTAGGGVLAARVDAVYSTLVDNTAPAGANAYGIGSTVGLTAFFSFGSVVALPNGGGSNCAFISHPTSSSFSYSDDSSCNLAGTGDRQSAADPMLAALADNGGPAPTRLPLPGSPLLDAIPAGSCQADGAAGITTDERGLPRPDPGAPSCDIGAVEIQLPGPPSTLFIEARFTG
jgi:hypothetical protein